MLIILHDLKNGTVDFGIVLIRTTTKKPNVVDNSQRHILLRVFEYILEKLIHMVMELLNFLFTCKPKFIIRGSELLVKILFSSGFRIEELLYFAEPGLIEGRDALVLLLKALLEFVELRLSGLDSELELVDFLAEVTVLLFKDFQLWFFLLSVIFWVDTLIKLFFLFPHFSR